MSTLEKILKLLHMKNNPKSYSVKMYAEMKLDDGRVIATEDEQFEVGSKVFAIDEDGNASPLEAGVYTMENGERFEVGEGSEISSLGEESEEVEAEDNADEEMSAEAPKTTENEESVVEELSEEAPEETPKEAKEDEAVLMSAEITSELITRIEELESKLVELSKEPAVEGIKYSPEGGGYDSTVDLTKLSTKERAAYYINNK